VPVKPSAGGKIVKGPLLVAQGTKDAFVPYNGTSKIAADTCAKLLRNQIHYLVSNDTDHFPTLFST
jgi:pimeloyl-ACP methyl ester carboxylesterase